MDKNAGMKFILRLPHRDLWYGTGSVSGLELYNMHIAELQAAYAPRPVMFSLSRPSAIDKQRAASHERGGVGSQKDRRASNLV